MAYGGMCQCCGETGAEFLTIDHINNNGSDHRRQVGGPRNGSMYRWLKNHGFPKDNYQLLCYNCNCAKRTNPECPHKLIKTDPGAWTQLDLFRQV